MALGLAADSDPSASRVEAQAYQALAARTKAEFPNLQVIAITLRESHSADWNGWAANCPASNCIFPRRKAASTHALEAWMPHCCWAMRRGHRSGRCIRWSQNALARS